jgi:hypothetical protein
MFKVGYFYTPLAWEKDEGGLKVSNQVKDRNWVAQTVEKSMTK